MVHNIWREFPEIKEALEETKIYMKKGISVRIPEIENKIIEYIDAPGKYLRAGMVLMFYYLEKGEIEKEAIKLAASVELFHLATLIHDDVIDQATTRRGIETIDSAMGNRIAVYAGDYLLSYSTRILSEIGETKELRSQNNWVMESVMRGELDQLVNTYNEEMTMFDYLRQIRGKTAMLFALSSSSGYFLSTKRLNKTRIARLVGLNLGMAFQLQDDLIDYTKSQTISGKPRSQDIQNGIYTAPLLLAKEKSPRIADFMKDKNQWTDDDLIKLDTLIEEAEGYQDTQLLLNRYINKALHYLEKLSKNESKDMIVKLINLISQREY